MGVRFEDAAVHKGPGVPFIGVAEHIFNIAGGALGELPLETRWEPAATTAAQAGFEDFLDDLFGGHFGKGLGQSGVAVPGNVFLDVFRIDETAVAQHPEILQGEEGDFLHGGDSLFLAGFLIEEPLEGATLYKVFLDEFGDVLRLDVHIDDALGIYDHDRTHGAETVAARLNNLDFIGKVALIELVDKGLLDGNTARCVASRASADQ
ncbi:MAG: hypothetical protein A4E73_03045 [Syntrophaceae bacterium PtaU1.Bin231]|nr:MAG: hypothetical protein A4E73_03045 [Syntrophaceae bacterium PtaU1.Bin231]